MNHEDHIRATRRFLQASELLMDAGMDMAAAGCVWGAAVQVIDAAYRQHPPRHPQNRERTLTVSLLAERYQQTNELIDGFMAVRNDLHNHFYTGRLNAQDLAERLAVGIAFVNTMLNLAERERTD